MRMGKIIDDSQLERQALQEYREKLLEMASEPMLLRKFPSMWRKLVLGMLNSQEVGEFDLLEALERYRSVLGTGRNHFDAFIGSTFGIIKGPSRWNRMDVEEFMGEMGVDKPTAIMMWSIAQHTYYSEILWDKVK